MTRRKRIAVLVATGAGPRLDEAARAAVGLTLRGDDVVLAVLEETGRAAAGAPSAAATRALATLEQLGHAVLRSVSPARAAEVARDADAVEVWT